MRIPPFKLEAFWEKYEFTAPYLLCASDVETHSLHEILSLADIETKDLWEEMRLGYTEAAGHPILRAQIADLYTKVEKEQILTTAGAQEGIYCTMRSLLSPGDHVVVVTPAYQSLITLPEFMGAEVTRVALDPKNKWKLELSQLEAAFKPNTKLLIINYPHNPTGTLLDKKLFEGMIALARASGAYIFSDEVYRYLEVNDKDRLPSMADAYEKGITINVMTKALGLPGLRIGWIACRDDALMHEISSYKRYLSICNSAPSEVLALMALRSMDELLIRNRKIVLSNLDYLDAFFERHSSKFSWVRPESGPVAFPELLLPIPIEQFVDQLVDKTGVLLMPGTHSTLRATTSALALVERICPRCWTA